MEKYFDCFTAKAAKFAGKPAMLGICIVLALIGVAAFVSGNERFINGANLMLSVLTLLLLPVLQSSQSREGAALQVKADELVKTNADARDELIGLEQHNEAEIEELRLNG